MIRQRLRGIVRTKIATRCATPVFLPISSTRAMPPPSYRLEPLPGYAPTIGKLVGILLYARRTTLAAVQGLSIAELDHLHDDSSNSIGALLAHIAVVERSYHCLTFEERRPSALEQAGWEPALTLGAEGRRLLRGKPLERYIEELSEVRRLTLDGLAARDDDWLERPLRAAPAMNAHFAWFHTAEDEINHRGQMRWLRSRLGSGAKAVELREPPRLESDPSSLRSSG